MNQVEKDIIKVLLTGGHIINCGPSGIKARDKQFRPVKKVSNRRFQILKDIMKKDKNGYWKISPRSVLRMHSNSWVKREYKSMRNLIN